MFQKLNKKAPQGFIPFSFPIVTNIHHNKKFTVRCAFQMASFGNMSLSNCELAEQQDIINRRQSLSSLLGFERWVELKQVHGANLAVNPDATDFACDSVLEADGACTFKENTALCIKTADCQPILITHKSEPFICALHVGWRGNAMEFIQSGIKSFCQAYNLKAVDLLAVRGPSLGPSNSEFVNFSMEWNKKFTPWYNSENKLMNLWQLTKDQLKDIGLKPENIYALDLCTYSLSPFGAFFSHRNKDKGRQVSLIWLESC
ncbi:polyphenol oxidase family protein [Desulfovibrio litoralis]|uniref:Purine nucleoside phosphorylase n=1 Tax=Desulfovibrio litoralis DSM 11393 TaxID=1121455 RepID=A0A1M7SR49_9BACT|nr:polyphenol oxidase family protein [Desulfovibrio litoralis]SHN60848.1 conserved hypothetical protein [Desulfovibrio litoralis DSM 11393]